jgi:hypothetical protein
MNPVAITALLVAAMRAEESKRSDRLFDDPFAHTGGLIPKTWPPQAPYSPSFSASTSSQKRLSSSAFVETNRP